MVWSAPFCAALARANPVVVAGAMGSAVSVAHRVAAAIRRIKPILDCRTAALASCAPPDWHGGKPGPTAPPALALR